MALPSWLGRGSIAEKLSPALWGYNKYRHSRSKHKRRGKEAKQKQEKFLKQQELKIKKFGKEQKAFLKKYGKEKFFRQNVLNAGQRGLLDLLSGRAEKGLKGVKPVPDIQDIEKSQLYQAGKTNLLDLLSGAPEAYEKFKAPIMREFQQQILPEIANRFTGSQQSSGFQNALAEAGGSLAERLGALRAELQQSALGPALSYGLAPAQIQQAQAQNILEQNRVPLQYAQTALGVNPYSRLYRPASPPLLSAPGMAPAPYQAPPSIWSSILPAAGMAAGAAFGGPVGGAVGSAIGSGLGSMFGSSTKPIV